MTHYNMLGNVVYNKILRSWRFRVKILRIHSYFLPITGIGPYWSYILADEAGTKMEMSIFGSTAERFRGLKKEEGKWVEIFRVEVDHSLPGFQATKSPFRLISTGHTRIHIIAPLNKNLYMEFKSIHEIPHMSYRDIKYPIDIVGVVFDTEAYLDDPEGPKIVFHIRDNIESQIKCVATGNHAYAFQDEFENRRGQEQVIVVLKMWRVKKVIDYFENDLWLETEGGLSDFKFNPSLPEVEEFRQLLLNRESYVWRHGAVGPM